MREEAPSQKTETGLLSSLYSYIALSSEPPSHRMTSQEDQEHLQQAKRCIRECHLEHLITESKFLRIDSLQEMVKVGTYWFWFIVFIQPLSFIATMRFVVTIYFKFTIFFCNYQAIILASHGPDGHPSLGTSQNENTAIFFLELLIKVIIQNR